MHEMQHILFVCSQNRLRSPTAEQIFSEWPGVECASAGVHGSADVPLSGELIEWAHIIFVMERVHKTKMSARFKAHLNGKRVICLGIPDNYEFVQPELVRMLESKVSAYLPEPANTRSST
jgi:predicted protein tyrosine phosphatase